IDVAPDAKDRTVDVPALADAPAPSALAETTGPVPPHPDESGLRRTGFFIGGAGIAVAVGGGAVVRALAIAKNSAANDACQTSPSTHPDPNEFDPTGHCYQPSHALTTATSDKNAARVFANVANVAIAVGAVAFAVGAYIVLVRTRPERTGAIWL